MQVLEDALKKRRVKDGKKNVKCKDETVDTYNLAVTSGFRFIT